ncbi:Crp family transcriptional regulatory protein [Synechococcus sp. WH 8101]|jgi:CRP-like cAMP-binding protein|uniref:Crp/Fnr family transcriptional regulator n=1 Tax=unclassified Synechococcus TaxID=2626047 RepID=UPI000068F7CD|nr:MULTISPECIES: Crp/Fnr family transcriptional regulator [unclassified Synechococcus]EAQ69052.1 possible transcriptional regulator [Synechococcus sp. RS9917]QBE69274.1 Crp family transcriptional regulatory protein [Synechococcus sp. WH 8101]QNI45511.1 transcriptional phosphate regulator/ Crp family [Synechococcus sp. WH 8101]QNI79690.1 transcriptional phosphate regulator/ Crp family [Synechococcus sp. RS9909]
MVAVPSRDSARRRDGFRDLLEANYQKRNLVHLSAGSVVPLLKNNLWLVVRGMVKLGAVSVHGDELLLGLAGPNEPFGEPLSTVEAYEAVTLTDCDLLCLTMAEVEQSPALATAMLEAIAVRYRQAEYLLSLLGLRRVEERVRGFLELLAQDYGQVCEDGLRLNLRLTHQEMASALSTTRVTVTRVIGLLRDEGWLKIDDQRHLVISHLPRR